MPSEGIVRAPKVHNIIKAFGLKTPGLETAGIDLHGGFRGCTKGTVN